MIKRIIPLFFVFFIIFSLFAYAVDFKQVDDRAIDTFSYSGVSRIGDSSAYNGTLSYISAGNSISFNFVGTSLSIFGARYRQTGYIYVYIDGDLKGYFTPGTAVNLSGNILLGTISNLSNQEHFCVLLASSANVTDPYTGNLTTNRFYFDYVTVEDSEPFSRFDFYNIVIIFFLFVLFAIQSSDFVIRRLNYDS